MANGCRWVVIDRLAGVTRVNADAIRLSDIVFIPCKPLVRDVWDCEGIVEAVKAWRRTSPVQKGSELAGYVVLAVELVFAEDA